MRYLYFIIVLLFSSTLMTSQSRALPDCPSSGYKHNCFGTYTYSNGDKYVGEWKDDKRNGQGTYIYAGENYRVVGEWRDNKLNGEAIEYNKDRTINRQGIYKNGVFLYTFEEKKINEIRDALKPWWMFWE
ncbi:MAG: hypothetical protein ACJ0BU_00115 [Candidatus Puniceispirillales bacterium]